MKGFARCVAVAAWAASAVGVWAAERGPVTNLPMPRFVSLKASEGNVRRGPSLSHRIDWVFKHRNMPLRVIDEYEHWRRVIDRDGIGGWVHYSLLSGARTVIIEEDLLPLLAKPDRAASPRARLELGTIAKLDACQLAWCRVSAGGYKGWAPAAALWGLVPEDMQK